MNNRNITPKSGMFNEILIRTKLILRLMGDSRVNPFLKIIPIASVVYIINPFDIPGPLDDLAIFSLALYSFVELCPPQVVQEHLDQMHGIVSSAVQPPHEEDVVDGDYKEMDDTDQNL